MDKKAIREFAIAARRKLIEQVKQKAFEIGISGDDKIMQLEEADGHVILHGQPQSLTFKQHRETLIKEIKAKGYGNVMEEAAYIWFNRFIALRFMEVNDFLPTGVRVLSSVDPAKAEPDIIREALNVDLGLDKDRIYEYLDRNDTEGLYKYLLIGQCNALSKILPFMFEEINSYTELLFPGNLLQEGSVTRELVTTIPESDWKEVEIIGWLYQYYISERKSEIVGMIKVPVAKEDLPAATQIFTPKWIVKYMVQNSLGKLWQDSHPETSFSDDWEYYLASAGRKPQLPQDMDIKSIKILDPACGSGHILVYAFDLLYKMYEALGYPRSDIPRLILKNNLFGLDIDKRAVQLASFALVMKARQKSPYLFSDDEEIALNILEFKESKTISEEALGLLCQSPAEEADIQRLLTEMANAKQFGSLLKVSTIDFDYYISRIEALAEDAKDLLTEELVKELIEKLLPLLKQGKLLCEKYHVVVTNPPYHNKYNPVLKKFMLTNYRDYKADLYSAFIYRCTQMTVKNGYAGLMTPFTWMFIKRHERLRRTILENHSISSLVQLEYSGFEEATVPICTFVIQNQNIDSIGEYVRLSNFRGPEMQPVKLQEAAKKNVDYRYASDSKAFKAIPGSPIAYWASDKIRTIFKESPQIGDFAAPRQGLATADNDRFLRCWYEVALERIGFDLPDGESAKLSGKRWFPYNKGGEFRKWYGNQDYVVNWENDGYEIRTFGRSRVQNVQYFYREGITWSFVSSSKFGVRYTPKGFVFDVAGSSVFPPKGKIRYFLAFLASKLSFQLLEYLNPTLNFQVGNIGSLPIIYDEGKKDIVDELAKQCIAISKEDWDSFETSWHFKRHPLLIYRQGAATIEAAFANWQKHAEEQFYKLKANEEELNQLFIEIYGLEGEISPEVPEEDVTINKADRERDIKSFISYAVGCMLGRYSLDEEGLVFAGGKFSPDRYKTFMPAEDGILPIADGDYFANGITERFIEFVKVTFGEENLWDNLDYIAETLGKRGSEGPKECIRRYFLKDFYNDHLKIYQKRPIYWLFTSRRGTFNALIYLHRYDPDTIARIRIDYLHRLQDKLVAEETTLKQMLLTDLPQGEKNRINRRLGELEKQIEELTSYDESIHHLANMRVEIDLDDGVIANYTKFKEVLAKRR